MNRSAVRIRPSAPYRGVAQFGSALGSGPRGRWFKSSHLDQSGTSPLAKANKRGSSASLFCLPSAFCSSLRSTKLVPFEIVTAHCVRLFRPRFARPYKSSHLDQSGTSPLAKANKRGNSASLFCLPSAFRSSLRSKKLVLFEIVTALCVRLFRPRFARPYKSSHLDQLKASLLRRQINKVQAHVSAKNRERHLCQTPIFWIASSRRSKRW